MLIVPAKNEEFPYNIRINLNYSFQDGLEKDYDGDDLKKILAIAHRILDVFKTDFGFQIYEIEPVLFFFIRCEKKKKFLMIVRS